MIESVGTTAMTSKEKIASSNVKDPSDDFNKLFEGIMGYNKKVKVIGNNQLTRGQIQGKSQLHGNTSFDVLENQERDNNDNSEISGMIMVPVFTNNQTIESDEPSLIIANQTDLDIKVPGTPISETNLEDKPQGASKEIQANNLKWRSNHLSLGNGMSLNRDNTENIVSKNEKVILMADSEVGGKTQKHIVNNIPHHEKYTMHYKNHLSVKVQGVEKNNTLMVSSGSKDTIIADNIYKTPFTDNLDPLLKVDQVNSSVAELGNSTVTKPKKVAVTHKIEGYDHEEINFKKLEKLVMFSLNEKDVKQDIKSYNHISNNVPKAQTQIYTNEISKDSVIHPKNSLIKFGTDNKDQITLQQINNSSNVDTSNMCQGIPENSNDSHDGRFQLFDLSNNRDEQIDMEKFVKPEKSVKFDEQESILYVGVDKHINRSIGDMSLQQKLDQNNFTEHNIHKVEDVIIQNMDNVKEGETSVLKVRLHPKDLGTVNVELRMDGDKIAAKIIVDNHQAKQMFHDKAQDIQQGLKHQSIELSSLDIDMNSNSGEHNNRGNNMSYQGGNYRIIDNFQEDHVNVNIQREDSNSKVSILA